MNIFSTSSRCFDYPYINEETLGSSIFYDMQTEVRTIDCNYDDDDEDTIVSKGFCDRLYALFKKDKETWNEDDTFLTKAVSDYLPLALECLISNKDHQDRLLFFSDIESIFYNFSFERGDNAILCRITPDEEVRFDLIQTSTTLYNFPNAKLFPKVMKSSSVSVITDDIEDRIAEFLRTNLFYVATDNDRVRNPLKRFLKGKIIPFDEDQIMKT
ncbi:hypothetical protein EDC94DRAFT_583173 [Helicostylum pulchrum]|nr:hypothetical protein EDC94DRAFT_583173 [Helicostylum pulchrum]